MTVMQQIFKKFHHEPKEDRCVLEHLLLFAFKSAVVQIQATSSCVIQQLRNINFYLL